MRGKGAVRFGLIFVAVAAAVWFLAGWLKPQPPALPNAYTNQVGYWEQLSAFVEAEPRNTRLNRWQIIYGADGAVEELSFAFAVERGGWWDHYKFYQRNGEARLTRLGREREIPKSAVPAHTFFAELEAVGLRRLEAHSGQAPPVRITFHTSYGTVGYDQRIGPHLIQDGQIIPVGPEGITITGGQGMMGIIRPQQPTAQGQSLRFTYLFPTAVSR